MTTVYVVYDHWEEPMLQSSPAAIKKKTAVLDLSLLALGCRTHVSIEEVFFTPEAAVTAWRKGILEKARLLEAKASMLRETAKKEPTR